ncbi:hypothetical protein A3Q56_03705 [Intoshia linei]|uniref:Uncharacterized protein n=1 Tax=Intoshia linei TaxID=1819745 RepID=A0A177B4K4_9BILA|nr:hypothetical protein A3Q56_03705 [Intoshia linei]
MFESLYQSLYLKKSIYDVPSAILTFNSTMDVNVTAANETLYFVDIWKFLMNQEELRSERGNFFSFIIASILLIIFFFVSLFGKSCCPGYSQKLSFALPNLLFDIGKSLIYKYTPIKQLASKTEKMYVKPESPQANTSNMVYKKAILSLSKYFKFMTKFMFPFSSVLHVTIGCLLLFPNALNQENISLVVDNIIPENSIVSNEQMENYFQTNLNNGPNTVREIDITNDMMSISMVNLSIALIIMLYKHISVFSSTSRFIMVFLTIESLSLVLNSLVSYSTFIPIYMQQKEVIENSENLSLAFDTMTNMFTVFSQGNTTGMFDSIFSAEFSISLEHPGILFDMYMISNALLYVIHSMTIFFLTHILISNGLNAFKTNIKSDLLTNPMKKKEKVDIFTAVVLKSKLVINTKDSKNRIKLKPKMKHELNTKITKDEKKVKRKKNIFVKFFESGYIYHTLTLIMLIIVSLAKIGILYVNVAYSVSDRQYENLANNVLFHFIDKSRYGYTMYIIGIVSDVIHFIVIVVIWLIYTFKSEWTFRLKTKSDLETTQNSTNPQLHNFRKTVYSVMKSDNQSFHDIVQLVKKKNITDNAYQEPQRIKVDEPIQNKSIYTVNMSNEPFEKFIRNYEQNNSKISVPKVYQSQTTSYSQISNINNNEPFSYFSTEKRSASVMQEKILQNENQKMQYSTLPRVVPYYEDYILKKNLNANENMLNPPNTFKNNNFKQDYYSSQENILYSQV